MFLNELEKLVTIVGEVLPTALDPRDLNPPCAWIAGRRVDDLTLAVGIAEMSADVYVIVPDMGTREALALLDEHTEAVVTALAVNGVGIDSIALDDAVTLPTGGGPLPTYRIAVRI